MKHWILFIAFLLLGIACTKEKKMTLEELRQQEIDKRVNQFIDNRQTECHQKTMDRAISMADSLLKINAVKYVQDSLLRPPLPPKPEKKIKPQPKDTVRNHPFMLPDTARNTPIMLPDTTRQNG